MSINYNTFNWPFRQVETTVKQLARSEEKNYNKRVFRFLSESGMQDVPDSLNRMRRGEAR